MKLKDFFGKNIDVNCNIELWLGTHDDNGELLEKAYGNENNLFEPWYGMEVVYITINKDIWIVLHNFWSGLQRY